jgi:hypothetical protein
MAKQAKLQKITQSDVKFIRQISAFTLTTETDYFKSTLIKKIKVLSLPILISVRKFGLFSHRFFFLFTLKNK